MMQVKDLDSQKPVWKINNIVVTADIAERIDLPLIASKLDCSYNPGRFPGLILYNKEPKATMLIFSTGKMNIVGMRRESDITTVINKTIEILSKIGIPLDKEPDWEIKNIVSSGSIHLSIDLNEAAITLENTTFEPGTFPGLVYRMIEPKAVFLLFSTGSFVCTGITKPQIIGTLVEKLVATLKDLGLTNGASEYY